MSTNTPNSEREYGRELAFSLGLVGGMLVLAVGLATLIVAMSVGIREGQSYLTPTTETTILAGGVILLVGGFLGRLYRHKIPSVSQSSAASGGLVVALIGIALVLFATAAESSSSAPFLTSTRQKLVLFAIAYGLVAVGLVTVRSAAKAVGW